MLGATNQLQSPPGTIRGDFCIQMAGLGHDRLCHGSDCVEDAQREINHWFQPHEVAPLKKLPNQFPKSGLKMAPKCSNAMGNIFGQQEVATEISDVNGKHSDL
jgi:hypothetical protein